MSKCIQLRVLILQPSSHQLSLLHKHFVKQNWELTMDLIKTTIVCTSYSKKNRVWLARLTTILVLLGCLLGVATTSDRVARRRSLFDSGGPVTGIISFGDSTVDTGNNNFFVNLGKADFPPYGRDFPGGVATGRFCNGKLVADYIADAMGFPYSLPYLDPNAHGEPILTGINFASSGSGWNPDTSNILNVKTLDNQVEWFKSYKNEVISLVGEENGNTLINDALYFVSTGANDYIDHFLIYVTPPPLYDTLPQLQANLLGNAKQHLQEIYDLGARRIGLSGVPAVGCLPFQITLQGNGSTDCVGFLNDLAVQFNSELQIQLKQWINDMPEATIFYIDSYTILLDAFNNPAKYGFTETRKACCGSGYLEAGILCNEATPGTCTDANSFLFWDGFHPTTHFYKILADDIMNSGRYPFVP